MATLYLNEQGTKLGRKDERLIVWRGREQVDDIPVIKVDRVIVMGQGVQVSTSALVFLAQRGIPLVFTNRPGTKYQATVSAGLGNNGALRLAQSRIIDQPQQAVPLVQAIVAGKLLNQLRLLQQYGSTWGGMGERAKTTIQQMIQRVPATHDADQLRGLEGAGAAAYWACWVAVLQRAWGFSKREYYPPPDPLNALLSFGYTLLLNDILTVVNASGLDPYLGFFHTVQFGRPSLALDLEEEFRPLIVDRTVLDLLDSNRVQPSDFAPAPADKGGVYASEKARRAFVAAYEQRMNETVRYPPLNTQETWRRVVLLQTQHVARVINGDDTRYVPMGWA